MHPPSSLSQIIGYEYSGHSKLSRILQNKSKTFENSQISFALIDSKHSKTEIVKTDDYSRAMYMPSIIAINYKLVVKN